MSMHGKSASHGKTRPRGRVPARRLPSALAAVAVTLGRWSLPRPQRWPRQRAGADRLARCNRRGGPHSPAPLLRKVTSDNFSGRPITRISPTRCGCLPCPTVQVD